MTSDTNLNWVLIRIRANALVPFSDPTSVSSIQNAVARFKPIGLTANVFKVPRGFSNRHLAALQAGMVAGNKQINRLLSTAGATRQTNYWTYLNHDVGTYANTPTGYKVRAFIVLAGGSANMPQDAVYAQTNDTDGTAATQLVGDDTYKPTFRPPPHAIGGLPPANDSCDGDPCGFWSIHAYQTDPEESAAPFLTQPSVLNTAYSKADLAVTGVDTATDTLTVQVSQPEQWTQLLASTPVMFGPTAAQYGLQPDVPYYVRPDVTENGDGRCSFSLATLWKQALSPDDVPIQGAYTGAPDTGPVDKVALADPGGPVNLLWGPVQPVTQLGSQQMTTGSLARNGDGSVTIWLSPTLPPHVPATNWLPTPSKAYYEKVYGKPGMPTDIRPMIRIYYPRVTPPSILPPPGGKLGATYVFPKLEKVSGP